MINSANKRSMVLRTGMAFLSGTRPPNENINSYDRAALLGCYIPDSTRIVVLEFCLSIAQDIVFTLVR
jgi:hypothetical protein